MILRSHLGRLSLLASALSACLALPACDGDGGTSGSAAGGSGGTGGTGASTATGGGPSGGHGGTGGTGAAGGSGGNAGSGGAAGGAGGQGASGGSGGAGGAGGGSAVNPHPLYTALDLDDLPGNGGAVSGPYAPPTLPSTGSTTTIQGTGNQAGNALLAACQAGGASVTVPASAGTISAVTLGGVDDCDVTLEPGVIIEYLIIGSLPGPMLAPSHRIRVRGGRIGSVYVAPQTTDVVLDGVIIDNGAVPSATRQGTAIYLPADMMTGIGAERFAVVNSIIRMVATSPDGTGNTSGSAYLGDRARDVFFANNNVVTAGNLNSWGFRINGGDNTLLVDNSVRVSFHKLVRMNNYPVDYVYIKGGVWMREATPTAQGTLLNDSFAQLGGSTTDSVFIHDPVVYLLLDVPVSFGAAVAPEQVGSWEVRNIEWHARSSTAVSEAHLTTLGSYCTIPAQCDYGVDTHTFDFDPGLTLPANPWRTLPTIPDSNPDNLPVLP